MRESPQVAGAQSDRCESRVVVAFVGETDIPWLRLLRPGFRHCFAVIECSGHWLIYDPASHQTRLDRLGRLALAELLNWLTLPNTTLICCRTKAAPARLAPVRPYTCVEAVKRILGIRAALVLTPWQLFRHLTKENKNKISLSEKILDILKNLSYTSF